MENIWKELVLIQVRMMKAWSKAMKVDMEKRKNLRIVCVSESVG